MKCLAVRATGGSSDNRAPFSLLDENPRAVSDLSRQKLLRPPVVGNNSLADFDLAMPACPTLASSFIQAAA
jgi:hypothetical protein